MWGPTLAIGGTAAIFVLIAWLMRRRARDTEELEDQEYRDPPIVGWPDYK